MDKQLQDKILSVMSQSELGRRLGKKPQTVSPGSKDGFPVKRFCAHLKLLNGA